MGGRGLIWEPDEILIWLFSDWFPASYFAVEFWPLRLVSIDSTAVYCINRNSLHAILTLLLGLIKHRQNLFRISAQLLWRLVKFRSMVLPDDLKWDPLKRVCLIVRFGLRLLWITHEYDHLWRHILYPATLKEMRRLFRMATKVLRHNFLLSITVVR